MRSFLLRRPWLVAPVLVLALVAGVPTAYSAFSATTSSAASFGTAGAFTTYPAQVTADGAQWHHRADEAVSPAATSTAADSSGNARPGTYVGATDGPSTVWKFDDTSGSAAADASGAANPGTLTNGPVWSGGHVGTGGLTFDGTDDVVVGAAPAVDTSTSFTVSAWAHLGANDPGIDRVVLSQAGSNVSAFFLKYDPALARWLVQMRGSDSTGTGASNAVSAVAPVLNRWTHLAAVYDDASDTVRLYVDGQPNSTATVTADWSATGPLIAGAGLWNGARSGNWKGGIDDVRAFRRALTSTEVSQLHGTPSTAWTFDPASVSQPDASGNGNTGTVAGGATFAGNGVVLDGTDDHVTGARPGMHTDRGFTVAAWAYPTTTTGLRTIVSQPGTSASAFTLASNGGVWQFTATGSDTAAPTSVVASGSTAATANTLAHVTGVYSDDADELRIYVNGKVEQVVPVTVDWDATGVLNVGRRLAAGTYGGFFTGRVDDLRVFGHALTHDDVFSLYATPAARYDFDDDLATTALDGTGNGHDLAKGGGTTAWVPSGHRGGAISLSSSGHLASTSPVLTTTASYSVSAWVYLTSTAAGNRTVVSQDGSNTSAFFLQHYNAEGGNQWSMMVQPSDSTAVGAVALSSATANLNRWTFLVGVYDAGTATVRIYVNGTLSGTRTGAAAYGSTGPLVVGAGKYAGARTDYWPGRIDQVAAYQRALTAADVTSLYQQAPALRWDLDENTGTILGDRAGNNNNGTAANGPTWTTGRSGSALAFDGVDDQVTSATAPVPGDASFTVSAWVYATDLSTSRWAASQNGTNLHRYALGYGGSLGKWVFNLSSTDGTGNVATASTTTPALNTWTHLTGVYDDEADQSRLYVNGVLEGTSTSTADWSTTSPLVLGYGRVTNTTLARWIGRIDEVYAYRRALRDTEIVAITGFYATQPAPTTIRLAALTAALPGALQGPQQGQAASTAVAFSGTGAAYNPTAYASPHTFTLELWFRASGTGGGTLAGFTGSTTSMTTTADRVLYLDSTGKLAFGVAPGGTNTVISSPAAYNDGAWHHVAASLGAAGMRLHVDGRLVAQNASVTTGQTVATGYFRWGAVNLLGWTNRPSNDCFVGMLDEVAFYPTQLADSKIARHHAANF